MANVTEFRFYDVLLKISVVDASAMEKVLLMIIIHRVTVSIEETWTFLQRCCSNQALLLFILLLWYVYFVSCFCRHGHLHCVNHGANAQSKVRAFSCILRGRSVSYWT